MLRVSNYCCFCRNAQGQLSRCNILMAVVKYHKGLKETKVFAFWIFCKKFQKFLKFYMKEPLLGFFYCKAAACNSLWNSQSKGYSAINFIKKRCLHRDSYTSTFLQVLKKLWTRIIWTPSRDCLWINVKERVCDSEFNYVFFIKKCSLLH